MEFREVKDTTEKFFPRISTLSIPNKKANYTVLTDERKQEFD